LSALTVPFVLFVAALLMIVGSDIDISVRCSSATWEEDSEIVAPVGILDAESDKLGVCPPPPSPDNDGAGDELASPVGAIAADMESPPPPLAAVGELLADSEKILFASESERALMMEGFYSLIADLPAVSGELKFVVCVTVGLPGLATLISPIVGN